MHRIRIIATRKFNKEIKDYLNEEELSELSSYLVNNFDAGDIIKNTGGLRKLRWKIPKSNKGKSAGLRIIYFLHGDVLIILLTVYPKNKKEDLSAKEKNEIQKKLKIIIKELE